MGLGGIQARLLKFLNELDINVAQCSISLLRTYEFDLGQVRRELDRFVEWKVFYDLLCDCFQMRQNEVHYIYSELDFYLGFPLKAL